MLVKDVKKHQILQMTNLRRGSYWPNETFPNFEPATVRFVPTSYKQCATCMCGINKLKESMLKCTEKNLF